MTWRPRLADSEWLTTDEAAGYLKVSKPTIFGLMRAGRLSFHKLGKATRFRRAELDMVARKTPSTADAQAAKRRCSVCGNGEFVYGRAQSTGRLYFRPERTKFFVLAESMIDTEAMACTSCGHVELFADTEKLARLMPEES